MRTCIAVKRPARDVAKAEAIGAELLLVVAPTSREVASLRKKLRGIVAEDGELPCHVWILPLGQAIQRLDEYLTKKTGPNVLDNNRKSDPGTTGTLTTE